MLISSRPAAAGGVAVAAILLAAAAAGCGPDQAAGAARASGVSAVSGSAATPPAGVTPSGPASTGPAAAASPRATAPAGPGRPGRKPTPAGGTTKPAAGTGPRITYVGLSAPDPRDGFGRPVSAMHQEGCGTPDVVNINVDATDPGGRLNRMYYEYVVTAAKPIRGSSDFFEIGAVRGDSESYRTVIGPIKADPANAAGGKMTITVHVVNTAGVEAPTRRITATLLPCR